MQNQDLEDEEEFETFEEDSVGCSDTCNTRPTTNWIETTWVCFAVCCSDWLDLAGKRKMITNVF